jgi:hypothetical protein
MQLVDSSIHHNDVLLKGKRAEMRVAVRSYVKPFQSRNQKMFMRRAIESSRASNGGSASRDKNGDSKQARPRMNRRHSDVLTFCKSVERWKAGKSDMHPHPRSNAHQKTITVLLRETRKAMPFLTKVGRKQLVLNRSSAPTRLPRSPDREIWQLIDFNFHISRTQDPRLCAGQSVTSFHSGMRTHERCSVVMEKFHSRWQFWGSRNSTKGPPEVTVSKPRSNCWHTERAAHQKMGTPRLSRAGL